METKTAANDKVVNIHTTASPRTPVVQRVRLLKPRPPKKMNEAQLPKEQKVGTDKQVRTRKEGSDNPSLILVSGQETLTLSSSLTESDVSTDHTESCTEDSSWWTPPVIHEEPVQAPPQEIEISNDAKPTSIPYAQLCFDPESQTLVPLLVEVNMVGGSHRPKRIQILDPSVCDDEENRHLDTSFLSTFRQGNDCSRAPPLEATLGGELRILSFETQQEWLEETDMGDLYLLHECDDPWVVTGKTIGCAETLRRIFVASRSLIVNRSRADSNFSTQSPYAGIGYTIIEEV